MHDTPLITTIAGGLVMAFIFGAIAVRLKMPPLIGYLVAGIAIGPHTPGLVGDLELAQELAEIGVILLMFGVGLHFSLKDLLAVKWVAIPGASVQMGVATLLGFGFAQLLGWSTGASLLYGIALSAASTVVLLTALQERHLLETGRGRIAIGWLVVEDLVMVLALVIVPAVAGIKVAPGESMSLNAVMWLLAITIAKVVGFALLMFIAGRRFIPWLLERVADTGSRELFRLSVLAIALGFAMGSAYVFGVSLALGAFFAGMVLNESELSHRAAEESLPLRDAFAVLFFVSVGMLFDPSILLNEPVKVLVTLIIIILGKGMVALAIVLLFRRPAHVALTIAASLAQIGEFSFVLASLGTSLNILPGVGRDLILSGAILSILLNPLLFMLSDKLVPWFAKKQQDTPAIATIEPEDEEDPVSWAALQQHVILVGYGNIGALVDSTLMTAQRQVLVILDDMDGYERLREKGRPALFGNAVAPHILDVAAISTASCLIIAIPDPLEAGQIAEHARASHATLPIIAYAHSSAEVSHLQRHGATTLVKAEPQVAAGLAAEALRLAPSHDQQTDERMVLA